MFGLIPVIKVNYSLWEVIEAFFISSRGNKNLSLLEQEVCKYFDTEGVIFTSSGRSALYFILKSLRQKKVVVPAYTCDVVVEAALLAQKTVIYAEVKEKTFDIELDDLIDSDTAVIATHQYGIPCDIEEICRKCSEAGAIVIEDCAGALGTRVGGQLVGTFGDYAFFSLNASKAITAPAMGGFVLANSDALSKVKDAAQFKRCDWKYKTRQLLKSTALCFDKHPISHSLITRLRKRGTNASGYKDATGYKPSEGLLDNYFYAFYEWQAKTVLRQFRSIDRLLHKREALFERYMLVLPESIKRNGFNIVPTGNRFAIRVDNRGTTVELLHAKSIDTANGFAHFVCPSNYRTERQIGEEIMYLPFGSCYTERETERIINGIKGCWDE